jgi:iron complex transport system substrate-binding protein
VANVRRAKPGITRRQFMKLGGIAAAGALFAGSGLTALTGCRSEAGDELIKKQRTVTDHAGRQVTIPTADALERIYYTSPLAQIYVFSLNPEKQGGSAFQYTKEELKYLPEGTDKLQYMGSMSGGGQIDREMLVEQDIQLIFSISGVKLTASDISTAEDLQDATGIPVVCVDGSFTNVAEAYRFVGDIMGETDRAADIASYCEGVYNDVTEALKDIKEQDRVSLYYAEGPFGLSTEPNVSQHAKTFEVAKARNVAASVSLSGSGYGMTSVSLESVIKWDPEVIVAWDDTIRGGADEIIRTDKDWANISAVKNGRVYTMPNAPFAWCDRPPGVNRFLGVQWVANMLYPDLYDVDMVEETKKFYSKLYWVDITDDQAKSLLGNSYPPYGKN